MYRYKHSILPRCGLIGPSAALRQRHISILSHKQLRIKTPLTKLIRKPAGNLASPFPFTV